MNKASSPLTRPANRMSKSVGSLEYIQAVIMDDVFAKIAENTVKFNLGDEEVRAIRLSSTFLPG